MAKVLGYLSSEPCAVCAGHDDNQSEPRFLYTVCRVHYDVPPAHLVEAKREYEAFGNTRWDK